MKTLNTVIREMYAKKEESVDLDESTNKFVEAIKAADAEADRLNEAIEAIVVEEDVNEAKYNDNDLVHIAKANVRGNNNPKTDKIIGYSKAPKNPNKFPNPKSGANAIMRIGDAKKKGFRVESIEEDKLLEDYFKVQYFGKDGKPEAGKESNFKDEKSAKRYLARAQKAVKVGEYKLTKEKGKLESVEGLDENVGRKVFEKKVGQSVVKVFKYPDGKMFAFFDSKGYGETNMSIKKLDKAVLAKAVKHFDDNKGLIGSSMDAIYETANYFGHSKNHGITDSLLAAVNRVVTGEAEAVEPELVDQNEIIEQGTEDVCEALVTGVQGKDGKKYAIELQRSGRKVVVRTKNQFGDIATLDLKKAAKLFEQDVLDKLVEDNTNDKSDDGEGLDKVQPKAVKKKFKDRKDKDIDNDGDVDDSDKFLHKKRKAISKAIEKEKSEGKKDKVEINPKLQEEMTPEQEKKREEIVLALKDKEDEFKKKYGDRAKEVMYATATKLAMKNTK